MRLGSYDGTWCTECNGTTSVTVSRILMEWAQFVIHHDNIWQTILTPFWWTIHVGSNLRSFCVFWPSIPWSLGPENSPLILVQWQCYWWLASSSIMQNRNNFLKYNTTERTFENSARTDSIDIKLDHLSNGFGIRYWIIYQMVLE